MDSTLIFLDKIYDQSVQYTLSVELLVQVIILLTASIISIFLSKKIKNAINNSQYFVITENNKKVVNYFKSIILALILTILLFFAHNILAYLKLQNEIIRPVYIIAITVIVVRGIKLIISNIFIASFISYLIYTIAILKVSKLYEPVVKILEENTLELGDFNISLYLLVKSFTSIVIIYWFLRLLFDKLLLRVNNNKELTPSIRELVIKFLNIFFYLIILLVFLKISGISLTLFAVFGGAIGVGIGFGLQKIFSNVVSGFILLFDNSIKPGDIIEIGDTYGWVTSIGTRFTSLRSRNGKEFLIPNEELITNQVINWSHSDRDIRIEISIGISYNSDVDKAMELMINSAKKASTVLKTPAPVCFLVGFGDSSVDFLLSFWIDNPKEGVLPIKSEVYLNVWNSFKENDIEIPFPQRDVHIKNN